MPDAVISPLVQETRESTVQPSKDVDVFSLPQKATSTKNFAVLLIRHFFEPHELDGWNVQGIGKPALNTSKVELIRDLVFKHYPTAPTEQETVWRECRKAIDTFLRNRK